MDLVYRPRRLRRTAAVRALVRETTLHPNDLIYPLFVKEGKGLREPIESMPGQFRLSVDEVVAECLEVWDLGIPAVNLFGYCDKKDALGTEAFNQDGLIQRAVGAVTDAVPEICVQTDVALAPYTTHGHDGLVVDDEVVNDESVEVLCQQAVSHADAGVDWVAPSDMMDGRIGAIRAALDEAAFDRVQIMSYAAKYASAFYGPFREAANSSPQFGDRCSYQMDPANVSEGIKEVLQDVEEGADIVMVKPALSYLDVISQVKREINVPLAAYNVSGEYSMVKAAAQNGWIDGEKVMMELLLSIKRAGAQMILTYFSREAAKILGR